MRYEEALLRAQNFGSGLVALGLRPGPSTLVGIYSQNGPEWVLTEQALYSFSMVVVPLYDTLGPEACKYIINQGGPLLPCSPPPPLISKIRTINIEEVLFIIIFALRVVEQVVVESNTLV